MREITILKDGIQTRLPEVSKHIRNVAYCVLTLSLIAAALIKRHDVLAPSTMVTNLAVIAMVSYPVAVIFAILIKFLLSLITSEEFTVTSKKIYGYTTFGRPVEIPISEISDAHSFVFIFKSLSVTDRNGKNYRFIGIRNSERIATLLKHLSRECLTEKTVYYNDSDALDTASELMRFSDMNKSGLITTSELEEVKKQLIGL